MRVTEGILFSNLVSHLRRQTEAIYRSHEQIASGRKVNRPSDDPAAAGRILEYREVRARSDQFIRNIDQGKGYLQGAEAAVTQAAASFRRAKALALAMRSDTYNASDRAQASREALEIFRNVLALANSEIGGRYLFSGTRTDTLPYPASGVTSDNPRNTGSAAVGAAAVTDEDAVTPDDYVIKFSPTDATRFTVYAVGGAEAAADGANTGGAVISGVSVTDTAALTLDDYAVDFGSGSPPTYAVYNLTKDPGRTTPLATGVYGSGGAVEVDGLRVVLSDGPAGGPAAGDSFTFGATGIAVTAEQAYVSGGAIRFGGMEVAVSGATAAGDAFAVQTAFAYAGNDGAIRIAINPSESVATNLPGSAVFSGPDDLLVQLKDFYRALRFNDRDGITRAVSDFDTAQTQLQDGTAEFGARVSRMETTRENLDTLQVSLAALLSEEEDADMAEVISALTLQRTALEATQLSATRIFETSLVNFLR